MNLPLLPRFALAIVFLAGMLVPSTPASASCDGPGSHDPDPECNQDDYAAVPPALWQKAADKAVEDALVALGRGQLLRMYRSGASINKNIVNQQLKHLDKWLKVFEALEAYSANDVAKLQTMLTGLAAQHALAAAGVPFFGEVWTTFEIVKISYEELEHQDCLLNIDLEFYDFLDDPALHVEDDKKRIDHYLMTYIHGESGDGSLQRTHRRRLQCYVNEELPSGERFTVDRMFSDINPLQRITEALQVSANRRQLEHVTNLMLDDFNAKRKLEEAHRKMRVFMRSPEYSMTKELFHLLDTYPAFQDLLCDAVRGLASLGSPDVSVVLVIDVSGSMNDNGKLVAAKRAAETTIDQFLAAAPVQLAGVVPTGAGGPEFSILPYSGSCNQTFSATPFSMDGQALKGTVGNLGAGGGTPMTTALLQARRHIWTKRTPTSKTAKIVLLSDGQNSCGDSPVEAADRIRRQVEEVPLIPGSQGSAPESPLRWLADLLAPETAHAAQDATAQPPGLPLNPVDTTTAASPEARSIPIEVSTIGFQVNPRQQAALDSIALAGGGRSLRADDVTQLASAFQSAIGSGPVVTGGGGGGPIRSSGSDAATLALIGLAALALGLGVTIVMAHRRAPAPPTGPAGTSGAKIDLALRVTDPDGSTRDERLRHAPVTIGREPGCDLVLDDPRVSRRHARIEVEGKRLTLVDLESSHGTEIDGHPAERTEIRRGSTIQIGDTTLEVR